MLVVCERWDGDRDRLLHIDPKFFWPQQHFFRLLTGLLYRGSVRAQALYLELVLTPLAFCPQLELEFELPDCFELTQAVCGTWLYNFLTSTCFLWAYASAPNSNTSTGQRWYSDIFDRMHLFRCFTGVSLDWWLSQGSICYISLSPLSLSVYIYIYWRHSRCYGYFYSGS